MKMEGEPLHKNQMVIVVVVILIIIVLFYVLSNLGGIGRRDGGELDNIVRESTAPSNSDNLTEEEREQLLFDHTAPSDTSLPSEKELSGVLKSSTP